MWGRVLETVLGLWLVLSPWLFGHYPAQPRLWQNDLLCGTIMVLLALVSFWPPTRYAYVLQFGVAAWLIGFGYIDGGHPAIPGYQNTIFVGLILLLLALVPNEASLPPRSWRRYSQQ